MHLSEKILLGVVPGQLRADWSASVQWVGLAGMAQTSICWLMLYQDTADSRYLRAAVAANKYVRRSVLFDVSPDIAGGVKGSFPIDGAYCRYEYPSWAAKFLADSLLLESTIRIECKEVRSSPDLRAAGQSGKR